MPRSQVFVASSRHALTGTLIHAQDLGLLAGLAQGSVLCPRLPRPPALPTG